LERRDEFADLLLELHARAKDLGLSLQATPVGEGEYEEWVSAQGQERTIVTVLGEAITAEVLRDLTALLSGQGLNIEKISRLSHRVSIAHPLENPRACIELSILGTPTDRDGLRTEMMRIACDETVDISVQSDDMFRRHRRLVVFDMDSTLIQCEVIDELARLAGAYEKVSAITESAMRGELDFKQSFAERLACLRGLEWSKVQAFTKSLPLMDGAERLISTLKRLGFKTAICSGGFFPMGLRLQELLGIDYVFANELESENGVLTGRVCGEIVDGQRKALLMRTLAEELGLNLSQVVAVGDGANDLPMISQAGLGIAFRAKPLVKENAKHSISVLGLDAILYLIGVRDRDLR
jgi:phosphoserine phosphatase